MAWDAGDYAVAGALVAGVAGTFALLSRTSRNTAYRAASGVALLGAVLLIWVNGAVGIIGAEGHDANKLFGVVLAIGAIGGALSRFQPQGMSRTLLLMALIQLLVPLMAFVTGLADNRAAFEPVVLLATSFFMALWVVSGILFRKASGAEVDVPSEAGSDA